MSGSDVWSNWLLHDRSGGDSKRETALRAELRRYVDRILDAAEVGPGATLVDLGTGTGEVAFRAIDRVGPSLRVLLTDISTPLLEHTRALAEKRGVSDQCTFLRCSAERLDAIQDASADVVTARAVLAYVADKRGAFREACRVLKPGGRLSIAEPLMREDGLYAIAMRRAVESCAERPDPALALIHRWKAAQFPDTVEGVAENAITNYSERDLVRLAEECGFVDIHMELHVDVRRAAPVSWQTFIHSSPHPLAPTLAAIMSDRFTAQESELLETTLRATVERGTGTATDRVVYLNARKPALPAALPV